MLFETLQKPAEVELIAAAEIILRAQVGHRLRSVLDDIHIRQELQI